MYCVITALEVWFSGGTRHVVYLPRAAEDRLVAALKPSILTFSCKSAGLFSRGVCSANELVLCLPALCFQNESLDPIFSQIYCHTPPRNLWNLQ